MVLILSTIFLQEKLSIYQVILIFIILILNILLTNINTKEQKKNNVKGILFAFGFLIFNGLATFLNKVYIIDLKDPILISFYTGLVEIIILLLILSFTKKLDYLNFKKFKKFHMVLIMEVIEVAAMILNRYSLINGNVAVITTITSCSIIITLITSMIVFKEKIGIKRWLIILLLLISIICLSLLSI